MLDLDGLPAAARVEHGLRDLARGVRSPEALWLAAASIRLRELGLPIPEPSSLPREPELALYQALQGCCDDPYYRYNAWRAELDSFLSALAARVARQEREGTENAGPRPAM